MALGQTKFKKINQKTMIREFENKLTKELLKIVHYNLQTSVRLSLFSKDVTVDFQFLRKTVPQTCSTDWNRYYRCQYDCLILGNFKFLSLLLVPLQQTALNPYKPLCSVACQQTI